VISENLHIPKEEVDVSQLYQENQRPLVDFCEECAEDPRIDALKRPDLRPYYFGKAKGSIFLCPLHYRMAREHWVYNWCVDVAKYWQSILTDHAECDCCGEVTQIKIRDVPIRALDGRTYRSLIRMKVCKPCYLDLLSQQNLAIAIKAIVGGKAWEYNPRRYKKWPLGVAQALAFLGGLVDWKGRVIEVRKEE
jgi:hypothetical protein